MKFSRDLLKNLTANITDGEHASVIDDPEGNYYLLSNKNIIDGSIKFDNTDRVISKTSFEKINKRTKLNKDDVVLSTVGTIGKAAIIRDQIINYDFQRSVGIIKCDLKKLRPEYLYYYFNQKFVQKRLVNVSKGAVQKCLFINDLESLLIDYPKDPNYQLKITNILSALDAKIELNNRINAELEAMARTLYDFWFVQFDFPDKNGKPYKTSGGKMVWNEVLKREIPEGWEVDTLLGMADVTTGKLDSNAEVLGGQYPFYTCASEPSTIDHYEFDDSVILIAGNNANGNFHVNRYKGKFNAYQRTYIVTVKDGINLEYLYQVINRRMKLLKSQGKGSQTKFLTLGMITETNTLKCKNEVMNNFHEIVNPLYEKQINILFQNKHFEELRDWLLPMLMNGQVKVV